MADEKLVAILKQGVHAWNEWRAENSVQQLDLRGADLSAAELGAINLSLTNLSGANLSYSSSDQEFAERLHADLQDEGVRCWFAPEDMKIGDKIRDIIDRQIRACDNLLLILSDDSISSVWIEDEVETAFAEERKRSTAVLFPVRIDCAAMDSDKAWAAKLQDTRQSATSPTGRTTTPIRQRLSGCCGI